MPRCECFLSMGSLCIGPDPSCVKRRLHENSLGLSRGHSTCKCFPTTGVSHLECGDEARDEERHLEIG